MTLTLLRWRKMYMIEMMIILKNDDEKEAKCPDDTSTVEMKEGVSDKKYENNGKMMTKKRQNTQVTFILLIWRKV